MFKVSKEEAAAIRKAYPDYPVTRTCRQHSNRSTYYATELPGILQLVSKMRGQVVDTGWNATDGFDGFNVVGGNCDG